MAKSKVAVLKVKPETILSDIERLCDLAGMSGALDKGATTILKDNISWHYPFPGANSTPWQMDLQQSLSLPRPIYGHLPLLVEPDGAKLSKSRRSLPLDPELIAVPAALFSTLTHLSQAPPPDLAHSSIKEVWKWAIGHWNPQALAGKAAVMLSA